LSETPQLHWGVYFLIQTKMQIDMTLRR